jgi:hypothetical protein
MLKSAGSILATVRTFYVISMGIHADDSDLRLVREQSRAG